MPIKGFGLTNFSLDRNIDLGNIVSQLITSRQAMRPVRLETEAIAIG